MENLLTTTVIAPFAGFIVLVLFGARMKKSLAGAIGCVTVGISFVASSAIALGHISTGASGALRTVLYQWIDVGALSVSFGLHYDSLAVVMSFVVTFVGFLIHLYASQSMYEEDGYARFMSYMNLFVGSMLVLVLADNLLLMYLGWEGVGACSYLLIGFWYKKTENGLAAQKAFIVTRIGDTAMAIGLFIIYRNLGTLDIQEVLAKAPTELAAGGVIITAITILLIAGAIGKSAQVPLHTWLPDAMAGPTPVSALIHAATMVTAGVYLIARMHTLFELAPAADTTIAIIGSVTLLLAGFSAMVQRDIKRVLAYSTMSQIGYMFLALGVGAYHAAIFHLATHAFFKALAFLGAGVVIDAIHHEHDIFKMGGLRRKLPFAFWTFTIGIASLAALPFVTAGFYSKDAILWASYSSELGGLAFLAVALLGSLLTVIYSVRLVGLVFFGDRVHEIVKRPGTLMNISLGVLALFSIFSGFVKIPEAVAHFDPFGKFMSSALPLYTYAEGRHSHAYEWAVLIISSAEAVLGIMIGYIYIKRYEMMTAIARNNVWKKAHALLYAGFGFDWIYERVFVRPFEALARVGKNDVVDYFFAALAGICRGGNIVLSAVQTGKTRHYATAIAIGVIVLVAFAITGWR